MADITSIPAARVPLLEPGSTVMSREWYRMLAPPPAAAMLRRAAFANSAAQTAAANTATAVTFNVTTFTNGVGLVSSSQVSPGQAGDYLVNFRAAFAKSTGGDAPAWLWLRKNGTDVANTAVYVSVKGTNAETTVSLNLLVRLAQTDYVQVMWATSDVNVTMPATAATAFSPAGPSALLSFTQVDP